ncbi:hypothetical protein ACHAPQ_011352 [Fusarium lateritium]
MEPRDLVCARCWHDFFNTDSFERTCTAADDHYTNHETVATSTIGDITNASLLGCNWCSFVATFLDDSKDGGTRVKTVLLPSRVTYEATPEGRNVFFIRIYYLLGDEEVTVVTDELYAFTTSLDKASKHVTARPLKTDVGSQVASCQIQTWLEDCKAHKTCYNLHTEATLPTRVIEVSPTSQEQPRVIESSGLRGAYATISYCWGETPFETLRTSNYAQCLESLDLSTLPLTFQNAIAITRKISIPYLWIDALCIVQDSEEDKNKEISSMKDIYARSALTIVASSATEVSEGFLHNRPNAKDTFTIPFRIKPGVFGTFSLGMLDDAVYDERSEPLAERAWTLQEQMLAQRTVTFASHTMLWTCNAGTMTFGDYIHYPYHSGMDKLSSLNLNSLLMDKEEVVAPPSDALTCWCRLVSAYSLRCASLEKDKLNVIAGVACHPSFAPVLGPLYFAGMWTFKLVLQLTWYVDSRHMGLPDGDQLTSYRPDVYRAPSWSWASIEGGIIRFSDIFLPMFDAMSRIEILECSTSPKLDENPFEEVVSAYLKVKGSLRTAWLYPQTSNLILLSGSVGECQNDSEISHQEAYKGYIKDFLTEYPKFDLDEEPETLHGTWNNNTVGNCDESKFTEPMLVVCLAVSSERFEAKSVSGLLLVDTGKGSYTRVGQFMRGRKKDFAKSELLTREVVVI